MKFRRIMSFIMFSVMVLSLFTACGSNTQNNSSTGTSTSIDTNATAQVASEKKYYATDEPLKLTLFNFNKDYPWKSSMPVAQELAKKTGITLEGVLSETVTDENEAYNLMMASGQIADIVKSDKVNIVRDAKDGAFIALDDLINEYAPNIKKFYEERPDVKRAATASDGKIYCLPFVPDGEPAEGWFIRKDWLDKLNLGIPTNIDELYEVLSAFRKNDPNGNGKQDEVPLFFRGVYNAINIPANLFGLSNEIDVKDNKIYYGAYTPEAIKYYGFAAKLYAEKLLDQEIFTRKGDPRDAFLIDNDLGGMTHDWFGSTYTKGTLGKQKFPHMEFVAILPPAGADGKVVEFSSREIVRTMSSVGISATNKYPVETIKLLDYLYTEEGRRLMNYGIEGVNYTMENGVPTFKPEMINNPEKSTLSLLLEIGAQHELGFHQDYNYELQWMNPLAKDAAKMYLDAKIIKTPFPKLDFNDYEQSVIEKLKPAIDKTMLEYRDRFIIGNLEVNEANMKKFQDELKRLGIEEYIAAYQSAYDRYISIK